MNSDVSSIRPGPSRVLLLGGTSEASQLATMLLLRPDFSVITSLAGRLTEPRLPSGAVRIGGFGGVDGLISYLLSERIRVVIDATHPFAARISTNAEFACNKLDIPLIALERPPWKAVDGDRWTHVADAQAAASMVDKMTTRIFLSIGRQEVGSFARCKDVWFLIRAIDAPDDPLPPHAKLILERGPFDFDAELKVLRRESIKILVAKNSGGTATYPKIEAARQLGIEVVMIDRPVKHSIPTVSDLGELIESLSQVLESKPMSRGR